MRATKRDDDRLRYWKLKKSRDWNLFGEWCQITLRIGKQNMEISASCLELEPFLFNQRALSWAENFVVCFFGWLIDIRQKSFCGVRKCHQAKKFYDIFSNLYAKMSTFHQLDRLTKQNLPSKFQRFLLKKKTKRHKIFSWKLSQIKDHPWMCLKQIFSTLDGSLKKISNKIN